MNTNLKRKKLVGLSSLTLVSMLGVLAVSGCDTDTPSSSSTTQPTTSITGSSSSSTSTTPKVMSLSSKLINEFKVNSAEKSSKEEEFVIRDQMLKVGDDNPFNFRIDAYSVDEFAEPIRIENPATNVKVEQLVSGVYQELSSLDNVVTIDEETTSFDFDELSIGKQFKITVEAKDMLQGYNEDDCKFEAELQVVDGFNVYDEDELSIFDNSTTDDWKEIKEENNLSQYTDSVKALIIQKDLFIKPENIPSCRMWQKSDPDYEDAQTKTDVDLEGALIDRLDDWGIYTRWGNKGEEFIVSGNYFGISAREVPVALVEGTLQNGVRVEEGKENFITSHAKLFSHFPSSGGEGIANMKFENVSVIGNSALNSDPINSGGLIMLFSSREGTNLQVNNVISNNAYIGYFTSVNGTGHILNSKVYNTFNTAIYAYGSGDFLIENSSLIGSGGPLIVSDHISIVDNDPTTGIVSDINIINSKLESKVSGLEPWFVTYQASTIAGDLKLLDQLFDGSSLPPTGKTIIADTFEGVNRINVLGLIKRDGVDITTLTSDIDGSMHIFNTKEQYNKFYGLEGEVEDKSINYGLDMEGAVAEKAWANKDNYVESNFNGGYINSGVSDGVVDTSDQATFQAIGFSTVLGNGNPLPGFADNLPYEQMRVIVDGAINSIPSTDKMNLVYGAAVSNHLMPAIDSFESLPLETQKMRLISVLDQTKAISKSYADGDYLNIYVANGMGVMVQLYDTVE